MSNRKLYTDFMWVVLPACVLSVLFVSPLALFMSAVEKNDQDRKQIEEPKEKP